MTASLFLTAEELRELTDKSVGYYQAAWLKKNGYPFDLSSSGRPKVLREYVRGRLGIATASPKGQTEPDFSSWAKAA